MALILLAVLLLLGAAGVSQKRGIVLCVITAALLFAWVLPLMLTESGPDGAMYKWTQAALVLVAFLVGTFGSFFMGHYGRWLFERFKRSKNARS